MTYYESMRDFIIVNIIYVYSTYFPLGDNDWCLHARLSVDGEPSNTVVIYRFVSVLPCVCISRNQPGMLWPHR